MVKSVLWKYLVILSLLSLMTIIHYVNIAWPSCLWILYMLLMQSMILCKIYLFVNKNNSYEFSTSQSLPYIRWGDVWVWQWFGNIHSWLLPLFRRIVFNFSRENFSIKDFSTRELTAWFHILRTIKNTMKWKICHLLLLITNTRLSIVSVLAAQRHKSRINF